MIESMPTSMAPKKHFSHGPVYNRRDEKRTQLLRVMYNKHHDPQTHTMRHEWGQNKVHPESKLQKSQ